MVLAEFVKFKHGLYKSCGTEWFEGIMLEPCLLQPWFHVATPMGLFVCFVLEAPGSRVDLFAVICMCIYIYICLIIASILIIIRRRSTLIVIIIINNNNNNNNNRLSLGPPREGA